MSEELTEFLLGFREGQLMAAVRESLARVREMTENILEHLPFDAEPLVDVGHARRTE